MDARSFFAEVKRRNISEVALMSWLEEQNKGRQIGSMWSALSFRLITVSHFGD
jgi:hypothetical protein